MAVYAQFLPYDLCLGDNRPNPTCGLFPLSSSVAWRLLEVAMRRLEMRRLEVAMRRLEVAMRRLEVAEQRLTTRENPKRRVWFIVLSMKACLRLPHSKTCHIGKILRRES